MKAHRIFLPVAFITTLATSILAQDSSSQQAEWRFDKDEAGRPPAGWRVAETKGSGKTGKWTVVADDTAPTKPNVLKLDTQAEDSTYNLLIAEKTAFKDLDLRVRVRANSGKEDQGGGPIWRSKDENNYYICRINPLEGNFRVYKVENGKRSQLASEKLETKTGQWYEVRAVMVGARMECFVDGKKYLEAIDDTFKEAGVIGLWTKADASSSFDDAIVYAPELKGSAKAKPPSQVFVVNTQDASISLVDLESMKEIQRVPVGARPYGIAVTRDGDTVAVGVEGEEKVVFLDAKTFSVQGETRIGPMNNDHIVLSADGRNLLVANFHSDDVVGIDITTRNEAFRISATSAPHVIKYGPLGKNAYVTCKKITGISIVDPAEHKLVAFHQINVNPRSLTFSSDESKVYFGSFWVDGFFEMETATGKVTRLFALEPPVGNRAPQEVTYHGVEAIGGNIVLAANEGRSYVDAVDVKTAELLDRLTDVSKPCCIERIPGDAGEKTRVLVSNIGDGTLQVVEVGSDGKLSSRGKVPVGKAPKRVAFLPAATIP